MAWHRIRRAAHIAVALLAMAVTPALAQGTVYGKDCNPMPAGSDEAFQVNICRTHVACDAAYREVTAGCTTQSFLDKISNAFSTKGKIDADDVEQATKPDDADDLTPSMRSHAATMTAEQRALRDAEDHTRDLRNTNAANDMDPATASNLNVMPPDRPGGYLKVFEGSGTPKNGKGILISDDGVAKGTFKGGALQGEGEQILPDGTYRGGNYKDGQIAGKGFEFGEKNGKAFVTEGNFKADQPDGLATVTYDDKSSERVRWENGTIVARGPRAPAGTAPFDPKSMTDVELAIAGRQPSDYVKGNLVNGSGMIERVRTDGTGQFEEWEDGQIVQVGTRAPYKDALAPQQRPKAAPRHFEGNGPATPEEPQVASDPDPCRNERQEWASHYQGQGLAEISGITPANERDMFLRQAVDSNEVDNLMATYRQRGADPMRDPEFFRQVTEIERRGIASVDQQMASSTAENNQTWNRLGDRAGRAWVACMAGKLARDLQAPRRAMQSSKPQEKPASMTLEEMIAAHPPLRIDRSHDYLVAGKFGPLRSSDLLIREIVTRCSYYFEGYMRISMQGAFSPGGDISMWRSLYDQDEAFSTGAIHMFWGMSQAELVSRYNTASARFIRDHQLQMTNAPTAPIPPQAFLDVFAMCQILEVANIRGMGLIAQFPTTPLPLYDGR